MKIYSYPVKENRPCAWFRRRKTVKRGMKLIGSVALLLGLVNSSFAIPGNSSSSKVPAGMMQKLTGNSRQLVFIENKGQVTDQYNKPRRDVQYKIEAADGLTLFVGDGAIHYQYSKLSSAKSSRSDMHGGLPDATYDMYRMDVELVGADKHAMVVAEGKGSYYERYNTNDNEAAAAHSFSRITYKNVYPHVDWILYSAGGRLKHEFVVHKGGRVSDIKLSYGGATKLALNTDGSLGATTPMGEITEDAPYAYQHDGRTVKSSFVLNGTTLSYKAASFNGDLVIDPTLRWGSYYGGPNVEGFLNMTKDVSGNIYMTGPTLSSSNIATTGAHLTTFTFVGYSIGYLVKFDSSGNRLWGTYYGSNQGVIPWSVVTDAGGNVYIGGGTNSSTGIATTGSYQSTYGGGTDGFLAKFNSAGVRQWGTYFGGSGGDSCFSIAIDASGNIYTSGTTSSASGIATAGAYQTTLGGATDAYMAKFNSAGNLLWATYLGGTGADAWGACNVDANGYAYVFGNTNSTSGIASAGAFQTTYGGGLHDVFVAKFTSAGARVWSTYYGGDGDELALALATDQAGHIYAGGRSFGSTSGFATPGAHQTTHGGMDDGFLVQFDTLGARNWCTYYGGDSSEYLDCIFPYPTGGVYIGGFSRSLAGIASADGYKTTNSGDYDAFIARFSSAGVRQWGTYYGGTNQDGFGSLYYDNGNLYGAGATKSTTGIATAGSYQPAQAGNGDAFLVKFYDCVPDAGTLTGAASVGERFFITLGANVAGGTWSVSNSNATISTDGVLTGVIAGSVTVTYTVTGDCGSSSVTKNITVIATTGDITGSLEVCTGGTTTLSFTGGGTWVSGNTAVATVGSATGVVSGVTAGTALITFTDGYGSMTATVTVDASPAAITGSTSVCVGNTATLDNATSGGNWTSSNTSVATIDAATGVVTAIAIGNTTISYTLSTGCAATTILTVGSVPGGISGTTGLCASATTTLSGTGGGTWSSSNAGIATINSAGVVTGISNGTATITYSLGTGCYTTTIVTVSAMPAPIGGTPTVCEGATTNLSSMSTGGSWSTADGSVATVSALGVVTGVVAGTVDIYYTSAAGCARSITVTVNPNPVISGTATMCPGTTTTLGTSIAGGAWTGGNATIATVGSTGIVTGIGAGNTNITYTVLGCKDMINATVNAAPATITGTMKACISTTTALSDASGGGTWSSSDGSIATVGAADGIVTGVTPGTVSISYTNAASCARTTIVTINPDPAAITGTLTTCAGSTTTLSDVTSGSSWASSNTGVATVSTSGIVSGISTGTATITYTAASTNCIATAEVTINGTPATIGGPTTGCVGSTLTLTNSVPGGTWSSANIAVATVDATTGVVTGVAAGMVNITYSTGSGCFKTKSITINGSPTVSGYPTVCVGLTTTLSGGSSGTWVSGNTGVANVATSGGYVTGVSSGTAVITFTNTSTTCTATYIVTVIPVPSAISGPTTACNGSTATLSNSTTGGTWSSSNTAVATVGSATGIVTVTGSGGSATISYAFGSNCRVTTSFSAKALPAVIGGTPSVCTPVTTTLTCTTSGGTWSSSNTSVATVGSAISVGNGVVTGVAAGTTNITYTITSTGCARSVVVTVNTGLNPGTITSSGGFTLHTVSSPTSVTLSSSGASGGTWTSSNPGVATINATTGVVNSVAAGSTTITYAVTASCTNITTKVITVTAGRAIGSSQSSVGSVQLYPNPTTGAFTFVSEEAGTLHLFSIDGKEITTYDVKAGMNPLNMPAELASGIYMCRYTSENGSTSMIRLVYER